MINVSFTPRVGVAPGTTTVALGDSSLVCLNGAGDDGPCLPEPSNPYASYAARGAILPRQGAPQAAEAAAIAMMPYGTESTLRGRALVNRGDRVDRGRTALGAAPLGLSWWHVALIGLGLVGGGALAYRASRR